MSIFEREQFTTVWGYGEYHKFENPLNDPIHSIGKDLHGRFLPEIPYQLINKYCPNAEDKVIDPFGGTGTTLIEALKLNRECVSLDISEEMIACQKAKIAKLNPKTKYQIINASCKTLDYEDNYFQLLVTSPPYPYAIQFNPNNKEDISNCKNYESYLAEYKKYLEEFVRVIKPGGFICQVLSDVVDNSCPKNKKTMPFISDVTSLMKSFDVDYVRTVTFPFQREITRAQGSNGKKTNTDTLGIVSDNILNKGWYIFADEKIVIFQKKGGTLSPRFIKSKKTKTERFSFEELLLLFYIKKTRLKRTNLLPLFNQRGEVSLMLQSRKMLEKGWYDFPHKIYEEFDLPFSEEQFQRDLERIKKLLPH